MVQKLTTKEYWNDSYRSSASPDNICKDGDNVVPVGHPSLMKRWLMTLFGDRIVMMAKRQYSDYFIWDVLYERYLLRGKGLIAIEVGSAPGEFLVRLSRRFGYVPYGVEYTEAGAATNRSLFVANAIPPENVIHADFFSEEFLRENAERYDIVISRGFVEHFDDVEAVIRRHIEILRPGGKLLVSIPNFSGLNGFLLRNFRPDLVPIHNFSIMNLKAFSQLFRDDRLTTQYCGYAGTFSAHLVGGARSVRGRFCLGFLKGIAPLSNLLLRLVAGKRGFENPMLSPYLIFIGMKTPCDIRNSGGGSA